MFIGVQIMVRKHPLRNEKGQASIFMALFISTMILLFAFTTNIGMLVHAKINLPNAADAAAYAGAAVQARQLTVVSYLNYEMRRALKEFLFLYTVRSQYAAMPCYPTNVTGQRIPQCPAVSAEQRYDFAFFDPREGGNNETGGPFMPTVCIIFDPENNYCQKASVPGIPQFPSGGSWGVADPIVASVISATNQIIVKKKNDCQGRTEINQQFVLDWLFNLYPFALVRSIGNDSDDSFDRWGMERLGVLPRMAILRARIDNFEEALNLNLGFEGLGGPTISDASVDGIRGIGKSKGGTGMMGMDYFERPIQAFLSARNNLPQMARDGGIFSNLELTELLPNQSNAAQNPNLKNPAILAKFNDITHQEAFANSLFKEVPGALAGNCKQFRELRVINAFPFGVTKDPNVLTYYAVRLQAKARLLFSPFGKDGTVTLSAYSAAKPFGSRIGKDLAQNPGTLMNTTGRLSMDNLLEYNFPNILVGDLPASTASTGFTQNAHLGYLRNAMVSLQRRDAGVRLAGAYAPWEVGYYNPPANYDAPSNIGLFEDNPIYGDRLPGGGKTAGQFFKLWAPVLPVNGGGTGLGFIRNRVLFYLEGGIDGSITLDNDPKFKAFKDAILSDTRFGELFAYMEKNKLVESHLVADPLLNDDPSLLNYARANGQRFTVAASPDGQKRQLTSWNNQKTSGDPEKTPPNSELGVDMGRNGYSVRFVSMASLLAGGRASNDPAVTANWENPFTRLDAGDAAARIQDDITKVKH